MKRKEARLTSPCLKAGASRRALGEIWRYAYVGIYADDFISCKMQVSFRIYPSGYGLHIFIFHLFIIQHLGKIL